MTRVLVVFGTRPEAIKMAPVVRELRRRPEEFETTVCVSAQHRDMLDQVLSLFQIPVDLDLDLMRPGQTLTYTATRVLTEVDRLLEERPADVVLVQGDTTTAAAAALAAFHRGVRVGHVEAGLRSHDLRHPFPEEWNRVAIDALADWLFAPTERAADNLRREGRTDGTVLVTGNTGIDALLWARDLALREELPGADRFDPERRLVLLTMHRRESFGEPMRRVLEFLAGFVAERDDVQLVYPVHPNPNVRRAVEEKLRESDRVVLLPPLDYHPFVHLMHRSHLILTDSGGIQEEAPSFGKPVLVLREVTERPEAVEAGTARVIGTDTERLRQELSSLLGDEHAYGAMVASRNPFGDGHAAPRIADALAAESGARPGRSGVASA